MQIFHFIIFVSQLLFFKSTNAEFDQREYLTPFENWIDTFGIKFQSEENFYDILKKWVVNELYIQKINAANLPYKLGHNQFSGMDEFDFIKYIMKNNEIFNRKDDRLRKFAPYNSTKIPESVDWVEAGYVTPVKDQGQCGSCWAFSTTGALEGAYGIKNGKLVSFSEQQLVDCDNRMNGGKDHGCNGGYMDNAFEWIKNNKGLCKEEDYPYVSGNGQSESCKKTCENVANSEILQYIDVLESDTEMMKAIAKQPVSVGIEADQKEMQLYKSGVLTGRCGTKIDHGVLAVGYGSEKGVDYYKVKNSWGESWGEGGYIRLGRGSEYNEGKGECGILMEGSYPEMK
jgi:hypothetical protein